MLMLEVIVSETTKGKERASAAAPNVENETRPVAKKTSNEKQEEINETDSKRAVKDKELCLLAKTHVTQSQRSARALVLSCKRKAPGKSWCSFFSAIESVSGG